jgi:hypothetical protein
MGTIASCGHRVDEEEDLKYTITKTYNKKNERALAYQIVCQSCKEEYEDNGDLFYHEDEAHDWLMGRF